MSPAGAAPVSWQQVLDQPAPAAGARIAYGDDPLQFGELYLPDGAGPHPVVVLVHGGCWQAEYDRVHLRPLAARLAAGGHAVWLPEYRRIGDPGGRWPNTLTDVADAADHLRVLARRHPLDLRRTVAIGHSAGGQLALWLATRRSLPADSELYRDRPLPLAGVIGLAAITDLATYRIGPPDSCHASVDRLLGGPPDAWPQRYAQASPLQRLPLAVPTRLIHGSEDPIVPIDAARAYVAEAERLGDRVRLIEVEDAGHFDLVHAGVEPAWNALTSALAAVDPQR